jgi:hypothetical protein
LLSDSPKPGWCYLPSLDLYIPDEHRRIVIEVMSELADQRFAGKVHGKRSTRNTGCTGPLCKKALRDHGKRIMREVRETTATAYRRSAYAEIEPLLSLLQIQHAESTPQESALIKV